MSKQQPARFGYRVLAARFVLPGSIMGQRTPLARGAVFTAIPCPLLRRAVRDGDLESVVAAARKQEK